MLLQLSHFFSPLFSSTLYPLLPPAFPHLSSCPSVVHTSFFASPYPILFLTSPCLFCTYHLCFLVPVPVPHSPTIPLPNDNPPCDLHFCVSVPVLVGCLDFVFVFVFVLGFVVNNCEFAVILLFTFFIFFFLGNSL